MIKIFKKKLAEKNDKTCPYTIFSSPEHKVLLAQSAQSALGELLWSVVVRRHPSCVNI